MADFRMIVGKPLTRHPKNDHRSLTLVNNTLDLLGYREEVVIYSSVTRPKINETIRVIKKTLRLTGATVDITNEKGQKYNAQ